MHRNAHFGVLPKKDSNPDLSSSLSNIMVTGKVKLTKILQCMLIQRKKLGPESRVV